MAKAYRIPRGTEDKYGIEITKWHHIEKLIATLAALYNITEFRTPIYEHTEVFKRENDGSDMVNKEMYTFVIKNRDGESPSLTLRPEGTAGLIRSFVENKLYASGASLQKYYYIAPNFRYERPQKGRLRIHHQFGVEYIGVSSPLVDVELISVGLDLLKRLGITKYKLLINSLGDKESQNAYKEALYHHFAKDIDTMCSDCQRRLQQNPLRILDCKIDTNHPAVLSAPKNSAYFNEESKQYLKELETVLTDLAIPYELDDRLVRGLDYYHHTVFEVVSTDDNAGAQATLFAGGRYNELVSYYGGPELGAIGFGMGIERILILADAMGIDLSEAISLDVYAMPLSPEANETLYQLIQILREAGIKADMDFENKSMKAQFKQADRNGAKLVLLCGSDELENKLVSIRNLRTKEQVSVPHDKVLQQIESWLEE